MWIYAGSEGLMQNLFNRCSSWATALKPTAAILDSGSSAAQSLYILYHAYTLAPHHLETVCLWRIHHPSGGVNAAVQNVPTDMQIRSVGVRTLVRALWRSVTRAHSSPRCHYAPNEPPEAGELANGPSDCRTSTENAEPGLWRTWSLVPHLTVQWHWTPWGEGT